MVKVSVGQAFAEFTLDGLLGKGGMGSVYLARHPRLPRRVALKLLAAEVSTDSELRQRFDREATAIARLDHPCIVGIHDRGMHAGHLWIAMQYIEGVDASRVDPREMAVERALRIITDTASALDYAHSQGVLHRDVKPANILLSAAHTGREERAILTDFGIARLADANTQLTSTGLVTATLAFASPEQLSAERVDSRSDQYSLACTFFTLLAGQPPFASTHAGQVVAAHLSKPFPRLSGIRADVPPMLDNVLARAAAKHPGGRFANCSEFAAAAAAALAGQAPVLSAPSFPQAASGPVPTQQAVPRFPAPPRYPHSGPRPAAVAAATFAAVAATVAAAGALRLWVIYSGMKSEISQLSGYDSDKYPLAYFGVGTLAATFIALLLFGGAGLLLAKKPVGRHLVLSGTASYAIGVLLALTADDRAFTIFDLTIERAVCVVGLIFSIVAAICALLPSAVPRDSHRTHARPAFGPGVITAAISSLLCAVIAAAATWRISDTLEWYRQTSAFNHRVWLFLAAGTALLLLVGVILLFARVAAGRFLVTAGGVCMMLIAAVQVFLPEPEMDLVSKPLPYHGMPLITAIGAVALVLSMIAVLSCHVRSTVRVMTG
ncbi:serine/threonine-protein kinase [Nocardia otitidiscaviarum]|uniref:serine/threonine-protein kinase n=1 Tax=Nocardia otitidiscaviarum TaxID=1823 RepID=UPI0012F80ED0|nr:serine/threonine-protein kinase [Nocardia otitidiscaviarum]